MEFKKLDEGLRPVRWIMSLMLSIWWGGLSALLLYNDMPILGTLTGGMTLLAMWAVYFNATNRYWYHDNDE